MAGDGEEAAVAGRGGALEANPRPEARGLLPNRKRTLPSAKDECRGLLSKNSARTLRGVPVQRLSASRRLVLAYGYGQMRSLHADGDKEWQRANRLRPDLFAGASLFLSSPIQLRKAVADSAR